MKNIIILEPNSAGIRLINAAHKLSCNVFIFSFNAEDRKINSEYLKNCQLIEIDTNDEELVKKKIIEMHTKVGIHAIIPGFEYYVPIASRMSAEIGVIGLPVKTVNAMRYKHEMRMHLSNSGLANPKFKIIQSVNELYEIAFDISFPCVLKPSHLAGSLYIKKIENMQELINHYMALVNDQSTDLGCSMSGQTLVEEYLDGREFSIEGYISNKKINFVSVTDKYLSSEPYFVETGHITRTNISHEISKKLIIYTESVINALDINVGPFHCEVRMTNKGPILIEIAARLAGDNISEIIELSTGVSLAETMVQSYLGENVADYDFNNYKCHSGVRFLYGEAGKIFNGFNGIEIVKRMPGFNRFASLMPVGRIIPPLTDFRARIGEIIFTAPTHAEVIKRLDKAENTLKKQYE